MVAVLTEPWRSIGRDGRNVIASRLRGPRLARAVAGSVDFGFGQALEGIV